MITNEGTANIHRGYCRLNLMSKHSSLYHMQLDWRRVTFVINYHTSIMYGLILAMWIYSLVVHTNTWTSLPPCDKCLNLQGIKYYFDITVTIILSRNMRRDVSRINFLYLQFEHRNLQYIHIFGDVKIFNYASAVSNAITNN